MTAQLTWETVLGRDDLIGGDIETVEDDVVYRGPISRIWLEGDIVHFESPWTARLSDGEWEAWHIITFSAHKAAVPQDIGGGRIFFNMPLSFRGTIFPKGASKLDPAKVKNLSIGQTANKQ